MNFLGSLGRSVLLLSLGITSLLAQQVEVKRPKVVKSGPYANSEVVAHADYHTVVPKGCVLYVPDKFRSRAVVKPHGRFIIWPKFLQRNATWLHQYEVTLDQARGLSPIDPERMKRLKQTGKVVLAVYKRNPISVLPLKQKIREKK